MPLKIEYTVGPQPRVTLNEIRELVEATKDWEANTVVNVAAYKAVDQRDNSTTTITVRQGNNR